MTNHVNHNTYTRAEITAMVLESKVLGRSNNQIKLFEYLMQLDPDANVSEYEIANLVFNRKGDFDPTIDSVVRAEIYRLRRNLERFSASSEHVKIEIPPRRYLPVITILPTKKKKKLNAFVLGLALSGLLLLGIAFLTIRTLQNSPEPVISGEKLQEIFLQKIRIIPPSLTDDALADNFMKQLVTQFTHDISAHNTVWLVNSEESDYRIEFKLEKNAHSKEAEIFIFVYTNTGSLIYSKPYTFFIDQSAVETRKLSQKIFTEAFDLNSPVVRFHANNADVDPRRRYLYQCALDALTFTAEDTPNYLGDNYLACLDPTLTDLPVDKGFIFTIQADVYSQIALGNIDLPIANPLEKARAALKQARKHSYLRQGYFILKLRVELMSDPIDITELRASLDDFYNRYPDSDVALYLIAESESKFFDNWERAEKLALQAIGEMLNEPHYARVILFNHAVIKEDWAEAQKQHALTPKNLAIAPLIPVVQMACATQDKKLIAELRTDLASLKVTSWSQVVENIKSRHYHGHYEGQIIKSDYIKTCGLF